MVMPRPVMVTGLVLFMLFAQAAGAEEIKAVKNVKGTLSLMVLGSGGPLPPAGRASSSYLIFTDGQARVLIDAGGGAFQRFATSGANIKDLDIVLLSHLHVDHTADLSAFIKAIFFQKRAAEEKREAAIQFFGPGSNNVTFANSKITQYPSTREYVDAHYHPHTGIERYLNGFTQALSAGRFAYETHNISSDLKKPAHTILEKDGLTIKAVAVTHGPAPSLAYRIEYKGKSIVYSGDSNSQTDNLINLAIGADLFVYDTAIMDNIPDIKKNPEDKLFYALHTTPSRMGEIARQTGVSRLLLSHITPITQPRLNEVKELIEKQGYKGNIVVAEDLKVYNIK